MNDPLKKAAKEYAKDKFMPVQTANAFISGAEWMVNFIQEGIKKGE